MTNVKLFDYLKELLITKIKKDNINNYWYLLLKDSDDFSKQHTITTLKSFENHTNVKLKEWFDETMKTTNLMFITDDEKQIILQLRGNKNQNN